MHGRNYSFILLFTIAHLINWRCTNFANNFTVDGDLIFKYFLGYALLVAAFRDKTLLRVWLKSNHHQPTLLHFFAQVHSPWQCNIDVVSGQYLIRGRLEGQKHSFTYLFEIACLKNWFCKNFANKFTVDDIAIFMYFLGRTLSGSFKDKSLLRVWLKPNI